jgi:hypothetical protein
MGLLGVWTPSIGWCSESVSIRRSGVGETSGSVRKGKLKSVSRLVRNTVVQVQVNIRPTVSRPVCLRVGLPPSGAHDQIFLLSDDCWFLDVGHPL